MKIAEIKERLSITQVLNYYNFTVDNNRLFCPFHEDRNTSMNVCLETNTVSCSSGSCDKYGKVIDIIAFISYQEPCLKSQAISQAKQILEEAIIRAKTGYPFGYKERLQILGACNTQQGIHLSLLLKQEANFKEEHLRELSLKESERLLAFLAGGAAYLKSTVDSLISQIELK